MRRFLSVLVLSVQVLSLRSQDTIVKRDGQHIVSKVAEINPHDVRYKKIDNPDGPLYTLPKEEISYVAYANGTKDLFDSYVPPRSETLKRPPDLSIQPAGKYYYYKDFKIAEPDMHAVVRRLKDPRLNVMIKNTENMKFVQDVAFIVSVPVFFSGLYIFEKNQSFRGRRGRIQISTTAQQQGQKTGAILMLAALALDAVAISFMLDRRRHNHLLVAEYNRKVALVEP